MPCEWLRPHVADLYPDKRVHLDKLPLDACNQRCQQRRVLPLRAIKSSGKAPVEGGLGQRDQLRVNVAPGALQIRIHAGKWTFHHHDYTPLSLVLSVTIDVSDWILRAVGKIFNDDSANIPVSSRGIRNLSDKLPTVWNDFMASIDVRASHRRSRPAPMPRPHRPRESPVDERRTRTLPAIAACFRPSTRYESHHKALAASFLRETPLRFESRQVDRQSAPVCRREWPQYPRRWRANQSKRHGRGLHSSMFRFQEDQLRSIRQGEPLPHRDRISEFQSLGRSPKAFNSSIIATFSQSRSSPK